jgi:hypothetical protein
MDLIVEIEIAKHAEDIEHGEERTDGPHTSYHPLKPTPVAPHEPRSEQEPQEIGGRFPSRKWLDDRRKHELWASQVKKSGVEGPNYNENAEARVRRSRYLPCHYFDYMGGTSTGG